MAKTAPSFCEIWFINNGKHVWTRETSKMSSSRTEEETSGTSRSKSFRSSSTLGITCARVSNWVQGDSNFPEPESYFDSKVEQETLCRKLVEVKKQAEASRNISMEELLRRKKHEFQTLEAIRKVKVYELAYANEVKLRKKAGDELMNTILEQGKLLGEKEQIDNELKRTMGSIATLDNRAKEANRRQYETSAELKLVQSSIASLRHEKQRIRQQKTEAIRWLERWRNRGQTGSPKCNEFFGFVEELANLAEFSFFDLKTATCNFSESFQLGEGGYGSFFKGEMLGRTVAIKKLHPHNMQGQSEFQKEVNFLIKSQKIFDLF